MTATQTEYEDALRLLSRALIALQPYRNQIILAGGMVPVLYRYHPIGKQTDLPPMFTKEADVVLSPRLEQGDRLPVVELLRGADLVQFEAPGYRGRPGAHYYQDKSAPPERLATSYVELLTPLRGKEKEFIEPQPGLRTQALRYLDLLAHEPLELDIQGVEPLQVHHPCPVRLPHPATFVLQKILARRSGRNVIKQANDLAHVFDVITLTRSSWRGMPEVLERAAGECDEWRTWIRKAVGSLEKLFGPEADGPIEVSRIYRSVLGDAAPEERLISDIVLEFSSGIRV